MSKLKIKNAIAAVMMLGVSCATSSLLAENAEKPMDMTSNIKGMEKCYGIAKAGMNDCGNANHQCAGEAKIDGDKKEWLLTPTGLCKKIVGGNTSST